VLPPTVVHTCTVTGCDRAATGSVRALLEGHPVGWLLCPAHLRELHDLARAVWFVEVVDEQPIRRIGAEREDSPPAALAQSHEDH
jgi:hypothetical protein